MKFFLAIFILFCLCIKIHSLEPKPTPIMLKACAYTNRRDLCIQTLSSDPNSFNTDPNGMAVIALRLASLNASDIAESIKVMFNDTKNTDPGVQQGLFDCLDQYVDASQQLDDAIAAFQAKAYKDVETWVKVAIADAQTCEGSFSAKSSVLSHKNRVFTQLCNMAISITKLAVSGSGH